MVRQAPFAASVGVGQSFEARLEVINVSKVPLELLAIENLPSDLVAFHENHELTMCSIDLGRKTVDAFGLVTVKFNLRAPKAGVFSFSPKITYGVKGSEEINVSQSNPFAITVQSMIIGKIGYETLSVPILPGRVSTGLLNLDVLLFGGFPEKYTTILSASPSDQRTKIMQVLSSNHPYLALPFKEPRASIYF